MAGKPIMINGVYYSRIYIRVGKNNYKDKKIHLGTSNKLEAEARMVSVRQAEPFIKLGKKISMPWQNENQKIEIVRLIINTAIKEYIRFKKWDLEHNSFSNRMEKQDIDVICS